MVAVIAKANRRPMLELRSLGDLLHDVRAGRVRVPALEPADPWSSGAVVALLDSAWRGYPIGTLLLWKRPGPAGRVAVDGVAWDVSEQPVSWTVVDGRRRVALLASALIGDVERTEPVHHYFDLSAGTIVHAQPDHASATLLPLDRVLEVDDLRRWLGEHRAALTPGHVSLALSFGRALREYDVAVTRVDDDERVVRDIVGRLDPSHGVAALDDRFRSLHRPLAPVAPLRFDDEQFIAYVRDRVTLQDGWQRAVVFLRQDAKLLTIPSVHAEPMARALARFFATFHAPGARARRLLTRWLWRAIAVPDALVGEDPDGLVVHELGGGATDDEIASRMLAVLPARPAPYRFDDRFDLTRPASQLHAHAMAHLRPLHLRTGLPLSISLQEGDFVPVLGLDIASAGNWILHPDPIDVLAALAARPAEHILASHAISDDALATLGAENPLGFLARRRADLDELATQMIDRHAEWDHSDRPSIETLSDEEE